MDIVFDQKFQVVGGGGLPVSLGFRDVIFVMEDVDAASPIVHSRDRSRRNRGSKTTLKVLIPIYMQLVTTIWVLWVPSV